MSEFSDAVRELKAAAALLSAAAGHAPSGGGQAVNPGASTTGSGGNLNQHQQLQALNQALGQTPQISQRASNAIRALGSDLRQVGGDAANFVSNFAESKIRGLGLNLLQTGLNAVASEADHIAKSTIAFEQWRQATGQLPASAHTFGELTASIEGTRSELEALAFTPALSVLESHISSLSNTANNSKLEETFTGIGDALGRITQSNLQGIETGLNLLEAGARSLEPAVTVLTALGLIHLPELPPVDPSVAQSYAGIAVSAEDWRKSTAEAAQEIPGLTADLQRLQDRAQGLRDNYEAGVQPLRDQLDTLNKQYEAAQRLKALTDAQRDVTREQGLAVDVFSAAGQAANQALPGDLQRLQDLQAQAAHQAQVDKIQGSIDYQTKDYNVQNDAIQKMQRTTQRQLADAQNGIGINAKAGWDAMAGQYQPGRAPGEYVSPYYANRYTTHELPNDNPGITSGGSFGAVSVTVNINGVAAGGGAGMEGALRQLLENPAIKTLISQAATRR